MNGEKGKKSFELSLTRLEEISRLLDTEDIDLDKAIALYEEGIQLSKECYSTLKEAELKVSKLKRNIENTVTEANSLGE